MQLLKVLLPACLLSITTFLQAQPSYPPAPAAAQTIDALEWFIDHDPGFGNGNPIPISPATDISSLTPDISLIGVRPGIHRLFVRSRDHAGNWSIVNSALFTNIQPVYAPPPPALSAITEVEVFFDRDPGFGKGFKQVVPAGTDITNFDLSVGVDTLPAGTHQLFVRSLNGSWSLSGIGSFNNNAPLPLTWLSVQGEIVNDQAVIRWSTAQESNTRAFEVEHSTDGNRYAMTGSLPAAGNSTAPLDYKWIDRSPSIGINYYRIKQIDVDGHYTYSIVIILVYGKGLTRTIAAPNPVISDLMLFFPAHAELTSFSVYNAAGQLIITGRVNKGALQQRIDFSSLPSGLYTILLRKNSGVESLRIVKE